jgi:gliding motility-associated-like protein
MKYRGKIGKLLQSVAMKLTLTITTAVFLLCGIPRVRAQDQLISTIAGNHQEGFSGIGGPAIKAELGFMYGVVVDKAGNVYCADQANNVIWKISPGGNIYLYAGTGTQGYSGDGGQANQALLYAPSWVGMTPNGDLYFTDQQGIYIRKISAGGVISTVAGNPAQHFSGGDGGLFSAASFNSIRGIVSDAVGNIYISDNNSIRKVDASGTINTIAGTGTSGYSGDGGPATAAQLNEPYGVAVDKNGSIYVPDANNNIIRKIDQAGIITTIAGISQSAGYSGDGGPAVNAKFDFPWAIAVDDNGNLYVDDEGNWEIRKIDPSGTITAYGGDHLVGYSGDGGPAIDASISFPSALACDASGNLYFTDIYNYVVRVIKPCVAVAGASDPTVSIATANATVCSGMSILFKAAITDGGSSPAYQWQVNGVAAGPDSVLFSTDSLRDGDVVSCVLMAPGSCRAPVPSNTIAMTVKPSPTVQVRPDTAIAYGQSVLLNSVLGGPVAGYQWTPSVGLDNATLADPVASPEVTTMYRLTVAAGNGCKASDSVTVAVYRKFQLPNAFTPNGDGKNDVFRVPPGVGVRLVSMAVYNRLGEQVFRSARIDNGWDGTVGGQKQPAGVYIWAVEYVDLLTGKKIRLNGTVMLIR